MPQDVPEVLQEEKTESWVSKYPPGLAKGTKDSEIAFLHHWICMREKVIMLINVCERERGGGSLRAVRGPPS